MMQSELNREVAKATGVTVSVISGMAFVPLTRAAVEVERDRELLYVDWDEVKAEREVIHPV